MPKPPPPSARAWLESPLRTGAGELQLAGRLQDVPGIDPGAMRVLGSYALVLMVEGRGYYHDPRGGSREIGPGDAVLVYPDIPHAYGPVAGQPWTQIYFVFSGPQFDLWRRRGLLRPERPVLRLGAVDYWQERLQHVLELEPPGRRGAALRAFGRFLEVLAEMIATDAEAGLATEHEAWFDQSVRLLGHRSAKGWLTPHEVAREVGLSYENFRKRFVRLSGESPGQYQKRRRLEWARAAIYQGDRSIKQIAGELGFCDVFHFSKAFKQVVGLTPSDFRRRMRGG